MPQIRSARPPGAASFYSHYLLTTTAVASIALVADGRTGIAIAPPADDGTEVATSNDGRAIALTQARAVALERSPTLGSASVEVRAHDGHIVQARLAPKSQIGTEVDNFAGSSSRIGFDESQTTLRLGQLIELGGKRQRRVESAPRAPDVPVVLGMHFYRQGDDAAVVADASVPLLLFNRFPGSSTEASLRVEATTLRDSLVPHALTVLDETTAPYRTHSALGLELFDAQRALLAARKDTVAALESFHLQATGIERLTSAPIPSETATENRP